MYICIIEVSRLFSSPYSYFLFHLIAIFEFVLQGPKQMTAVVGVLSKVSRQCFWFLSCCDVLYRNPLRISGIPVLLGEKCFKKYYHFVFYLALLLGCCFLTYKRWFYFTIAAFIFYVYITSVVFCLQSSSVLFYYICLLIFSPFIITFFFHSSSFFVYLLFIPIIFNVLPLVAI